MKSAAICLAALLLAGCSKNIDTPEAVKEGVIKDIAKKVDVGSMDVNVDSVSFREKEADATVSFTPKGAPRSQSMTMNYALERQGDEWHIKSRSMLTPHAQAQPGQAAALPAGHPGVASSPARHTAAARTSDSQHRTQTMKVAVLGGGPSGAFAAEQLASAGVETVVFDEKLAWEKPCGGGLT